MVSNELSIGRAGEYLVLADLLIRGIECFDTGQGVGFDVVAISNNRLIRLQVKTTSCLRKTTQRRNPVYFFHINRRGREGKHVYARDSFDGFALVALDKKEIFYLNFDDKVKSHSICVRDKKIDYADTNRGIYYQDLTWENFINENDKNSKTC
jgi:hypothetical protein